MKYWSLSADTPAMLLVGDPGPFYSLEFDSLLSMHPPFYIMKEGAFPSLSVMILKFSARKESVITVPEVGHPFLGSFNFLDSADRKDALEYAGYIPMERHCPSMFLFKSFTI